MPSTVRTLSLGEYSSTALDVFSNNVNFDITEGDATLANGGFHAYASSRGSLKHLVGQFSIAPFAASPPLAATQIFTMRLPGIYTTLQSFVGFVTRSVGTEILTDVGFIYKSANETEPGIVHISVDLIDTVYNKVFVDVYYRGV